MAPSMAASTSALLVLAGDEIAGIAAVAQHYDAIGNLEHLAHVVRDVDHRDPLLLSAGG